MNLAIVNLADRPDLAHTTATWRWEAFFKGRGMSLAEIPDLDTRSAENHDLLPTVLVMLEEQRPVGMVALCSDDLDGRPDLNPWLAGLYVDPVHRGKGHAMRLIQELEGLAKSSGVKRLSLFSADAAGLYAKAGWTTIENFEMEGRIFNIMRKHL